MRFKAFLVKYLIQSNKDIKITFDAYASPSDLQNLIETNVKCTLNYNNNLIVFTGKTGELKPYNPAKIVYNPEIPNSHEKSKWSIVLRDRNSQLSFIDLLHYFKNIDRDKIEWLYNDSEFTIQYVGNLDLLVDCEIVSNQSEAVDRQDLYKKYYAICNDVNVIKFIGDYLPSDNPVEINDVFFKQMFFESADVRKRDLTLEQLELFVDNVAKFKRQKVDKIYYKNEIPEEDWKEYDD